MPANDIKWVGGSYENDKSPTPLACLRHPDRVNQTGLKSSPTQPRLKLAQRQDNLHLQASQWSRRIVISVRPTDPFYAIETLRCPSPNIGIQGDGVLSTNFIWMKLKPVVQEISIPQTKWIRYAFCIFERERG